MNNIKLVEYQRKAIDNIFNKSNEFLAGKDFKKILLQAPTGSGKTIMMSAIVERLALECKESLSFIWISKGNLPTQSKEKFEKNIGGGGLTFSFLGDIIDNTIQENEVLFINWEEIFSKANKDNPNKDVIKGDWTNIFMRDNEQGRFLKNFCENTREQNRKMVLIIDESHFGITENTIKIIEDIIKPVLQIDISATPKNDKYDFGDRGDEIINLDTVKKAGIIKKEVIINVDITNEMLKSHKKGGDILVLEQALKKQKELKGIFEILKKNINPLVLIQLPNDSEAMSVTDKKIKDIVEEFLDNNDINYENKKLALWLSGKDKENLEDIENIDNQVECLIFKQAIALGWDCPRAYILVKFRDTKSATFEIQTVGRIMRMPEFRHYENNEVLNKAYVYANLTEIDIDKDALEYILTKKATRNNKIYDELNLKSVYLKRGEYNDIKLEYRKYFFKEFLSTIGGVEDISKAKQNYDKLKTYKSKDGNKLNLNTQNIAVNLVLNKTIKKIDEKQDIKSNEEDKISLLDSEIKTKVEDFLGSYTSPFQRARSISPILTAIYQTFNKYLGFEEDDKDKIDIQKIILENQSFFAKVIQSSVEKYSKSRLKTEKDYEENLKWNVPAEDYYPKNAEEKKYKRCVMNPVYVVDKWETEIGFIENNLEKNNNVKWWYKNGDAKNDIYFGIPYDKEQGGKATFYPDFIVYYKDNKIGIFDTKKGRTETEKATELKAVALQKYIKESKDKKLFGGILKPTDTKNTIWQINNSTDYKGEWKAL